MLSFRLYGIIRPPTNTKALVGCELHANGQKNFCPPEVVGVHILWGCAKKSPIAVLLKKVIAGMILGGMCDRIRILLYAFHYTIEFGIIVDLLTLMKWPIRLGSSGCLFLNNCTQSCNLFILHRDSIIFLLDRSILLHVLDTKVIYDGLYRMANVM